MTKKCGSLIVGLMALASLLTACMPPNTEVVHITPSSHLIKYHGRIDWADSLRPEIYWPGSGLTIRFKGKTLDADYFDATGEVYLNIIYDQDSLRYVKLAKGQNTIRVAEFPSEETHRIDIIKRNEWMVTGPLTFQGITVTDGQLLDPPQYSGKVIEFFGNSITAGYAIEDLSGGDRMDSIYSNNYATYAALTARYFNADYYATVQSGIGIMVSWNPGIMPELYDRLNPYDSTAQWDFAQVQPDVVVINLGQNDSWLIKLPDHEQFKIRFGDTAPTSGQWQAAYRNFVVNIRTAYPESHIVCAIGSMDTAAEGSPWPGYIAAVAADLQDDNLSTLVFPYTQTDGHPRLMHHRAMADQLIAHLEQVMDW